MSRKIPWFKDIVKIFYFYIFIILFALSLDFWGWGRSEPLILGLPLWVYYLLFLTLLTSGFFYFIAKNVWRDGK